MGIAGAAGFSALRHRDFAFYLTASFLATVSLAMQSVALGWQIYYLTGKPFDLGLVGLVEFLPAFALALVSGHVADRFDRRTILFLAILAEAVAASALVAMVALDRVSVAGILSVAFSFGVVRALATPAQRAMMPNLVPVGDFPSGVAWSGIAWQIATIGGPALGGLLYAIGPAVVYGTITGALLLAALAVLMMKPQPATAPAGEELTRESALAGVALIFSNKILLGAISLDLFAVLFSGAAALLPVFAKDILHVGPQGLGILRSAPGLGAIGIALALTQWPMKRHIGLRLFIAVGIFGLAVVSFGFSRNFWLSFAALAVLGAADDVSVFVRGSIVPLATPDALRGRVVAVESVFIGASNELGAFVAGSGAALLGPVAAVLVGGSLTLSVALLWSWLFPSLRRADRMESIRADFPQGPASDRLAVANSQERPG
jgi:MFS family permease